MNKTTITLAVLILASNSISTAFAITNYDQKNYSGANCVALTTSQNPLLNRNSFGTIANPTAASINITCPIVRDNNSPIQKPVEVYVFVNDQVQTARTRCGLLIMDSWGNLRSSVGAAAPTAGMNSLFMSLTDVSGSPGVYHMTCGLPAGSSISSYQVVETLGTDNNS